MKKLRKTKGFTLVELLVVVAILAILILIALPRFSGSTNNAKLKTFEGNVRTLASQVVQYQTMHNGTVIGIESSDVKDWADSQEDKPKGAKYDITATGAVCTLEEGEFDYKVTINYATGSITGEANSLPDGLVATYK